VKKHFEDTYTAAGAGAGAAAAGGAAWSFGPCLPNSTVKKCSKTIVNSRSKFDHVSYFRKQKLVKTK
jgi:hypothetical protein